MWPMSSSSKRADSAGRSRMAAGAGEPGVEPSRVVRLLLRKRYGRLGPAGDYAPTKSSSFRFGLSSRKSKLGDGARSDGSKAKEQKAAAAAEGAALRRSASTSSASRRTVMEKLGDAYVDMIWSAASHAARPIGAKPKVPLSRAMTFEKMFGEPHDTMLRIRSLNSLSSLNSGLLMTDLTAPHQVK
ncbi:hypothetical protein MPTK1_6g06180 [Marchantia polymorpha subsp. ruderalis]|uniref:Uncharacterized protein n=2 Tax=Marchantia polymorpha TaxID=3197 RepID=A0AAF6BP40_MARPO|nr:hypothetical protein MARPO_0097s0026 [Marchantia polymorpha]BBN13774.1 hypothetical protein Mp_6g06180 [Marchantia polymorpha subsp. ruderalis]|eukprot:PTQ32540.1 hypothetical protein MARPO_0097s0026 [Marchantia polymorpha]